MCGIAGFAGLQAPELLDDMLRSLRHRGPDGRGVYHRDGVGLGCQRLAIIDLDTGAQPVHDETGNVVVVFNGEIYNFRELRRELEGKGHRFKTRTDTEVIAHLYEEHGRSALERLSGMFALALWDSRERSLLLARDPLGVKPLYWAARGRELFFGSELKALLRVPAVSRELDLESLTQYLDFLYIAAPKTIYRDVRKLRPGEWLLWKDGTVQTGLFWRPRVEQAPLRPREAIERLDELLAQVVHDQLASDVPVGLFLSGGIDSTTLACYLARLNRRPEAFCAYFSPQGRDYNEVEKARVVARHFDMRLTELRIEPSIEEALDTLIEAFDEPLADSSALPTYWLSRLARQRVGVALTGIGGDEVFGGYPRYLGAKLLPGYQRLPLSTRRALGAASAWIPAQVATSRDIGGWARRFLEGAVGNPERVYSVWQEHLSRADRSALFEPALLDALPARSQVLASFDEREGGFGKQVQAVDLQTYLPDDLLAHADRMSMKVGLELRVPLCDQRLVEFALGLPADYHVRGFTLKPMLKDLLRTRVPLEIISQRKQGFMVPLGPWFQRELAPIVHWGIRGLACRGLLRRGAMEAIYGEHAQGRRSRTDALWSWVLLERWFERYAPNWRADGRPRPRRGRRILMVSDEIFPDSGGGGQGRCAWQESRQLAQRGHDVRIWCLDREGGRPQRERLQGLQVYRLAAGLFYRRPYTFPGLVSAAGRSLSRVLAEFEPEVVIGQSPLSTWLAQRCPDLKGARFLYRYNSSWPEEFAIDRPGLLWAPGGLLRAWVERAAVRRCEAVAAISDFMSRNFVRNFGTPAVTLPGGVDYEHFRPGDKAQARRALGVGGAPLLVTVRNLRPRMGWDILFGAVELLRGEFPGLRAVVVGHGPLEAQLRAELARRGLDGIVRLAGRVADEALPLYYQAADLFAMPTSHLEGLGLVLLEALACGTPCAGTPVGGIPEVLASADPGWVAQEATPEAFAAAIRRALASSPSPERLRARVRERYGWDLAADVLEGLFEPKPRLLHLVTRLDYGGSAENVLLCCASARRQGFETAVACGLGGGGSPPPAAAAQTLGAAALPVPSLRRELSPLDDVRAFWQILRLLRAWRPDILHTHSSKAGVLGRWAARLLRLAGSGPRLVVHTPHGHVFYGYFGQLKSRVFEWIERLSAPCADVLVALSEGEKREHLQRKIGVPGQWVVVPSGVENDPDATRASEQTLGATALPFPEDALVIGCVARLEPVKGVDVLLEAAAPLLRRDSPEVRLLIVGDGALEAPLREQARRLGVEERVHFAGYQRDPFPWLRAMHVYAQPSLNEGMGKALVQAQSLGLPVVASRVCGIPDVVKEGETGLLVPPGDAGALSEALERIASDAALRRRLGDAGRAWVLGRDERGRRPFGVERMTGALNEIYGATRTEP